MGFAVYEFSADTPVPRFFQGKKVFPETLEKQTESFLLPYVTFSCFWLHSFASSLANVFLCRRLQNLNIKPPLKNPRNPKPRAGSSAGMNA
jgi:hypothetical protein